MDNQVETYLESVETELKALSESRREEEILELRQHLESLTAAHQELGLSESAAAAEAIRQFGNARAVGKTLDKAVGAGQVRLPGNVLASTVCHLLTLYGGAWAAINVLFSMRSDGMHPRFISHPSDHQMVAVLMFGAVSVCFMAGAVSGIIAPRRALIGIALGYGSMFAWQMINLERYCLTSGRIINFAWLAGTMPAWILAAAVSLIGGRCGTLIRSRRHERRLHTVR